MNKLGISGFVVIVSSILFAQSYHGSSIAGLFDLPAFLIVFGGTFGAILVQTSSKQLKHALSCKKDQLINTIGITSYLYS